MLNQRVNINIPLAHFTDVLSWDQSTIDRLVEAAIEAAVKIGLRLDDDNEGIYLKEAESKSAKIDWDARAVMFTDVDVRQTMEVMRQTKTSQQRPLAICEHGRDEKFEVGNGANLLFDWENWTAKAPTVQDMVDTCHWAQGCDDVSCLIQPFMLKDINQLLEPMYAYALMAKYCRKRIWHNQPTEPIHVKYLDKMARVVEKHRGYAQPMLDFEYVNPPFRMGLRSIETMLARVDMGACKSMGIGPMSVSGMSAPVTVAGLAVTALAELLAGLTFFRILRPGYGLRANVCTGSLDLRTARVSYFNMHTHLCNLALQDLIVRGIGADAPCLTFYRDANEPGMQALYEYGMAQSFFSSVLYKCNPEIGGLCSGNTFSPHQAMLDIELIKEFNELTYGFEVSEEAVGLDEIIDARFNQGVHMSTEHTLEYMQDGIPFSSYLYRGTSAGAQHDKNHTQSDELIERASQAYDNARLKGTEIEPDIDLSSELYEYVKQAAAELKIQAPALP